MLEDVHTVVHVPIHVLDQIVQLDQKNDVHEQDLVLEHDHDQDLVIVDKILQINTHSIIKHNQEKVLPFLYSYI